MFKGGRQVRPFFLPFLSHVHFKSYRSPLPKKQLLFVDLFLRAKQDFCHSKYSLKKSGSLSRT